MKKSALILVIAASLLGLMYWFKPKPEVYKASSLPKLIEQRVVTPTKPLPVTVQKKPDKVPATNRVQQAQSTGKPSLPEPVTIDSLPGYLKVLVEQPKREPTRDVIAQLSAKDQPVLIQLYQQATNLVDRKALTWALGLIGDEEVVVLFKNTLTQEHAGKVLTAGYRKQTDEEYTLFNTVVAMGMLAAKSDSAYDFVKQGTDPWFWDKQIQWTSDRGSRSAGMLTSFSIQAIGLSGRPDVPQFLEQYKTKDMVSRVGGDSPTARNVSGDVVQAAFYCDVIQQYGMEAFRNNIFTERNSELYAEWRTTENGKKWLAWDKVAGRQR